MFFPTHFEKSYRYIFFVGKKELLFWVPLLVTNDELLVIVDTLKLDLNNYHVHKFHIQVVSLTQEFHTGDKLAAR